MTECYACAKLAELMAENNALRGRVGETELEKAERIVERDCSGAFSPDDYSYTGGMFAHGSDTREKLEADARALQTRIWQAGANSDGISLSHIIELLDRQAAITEREFIEAECMKCAKADKERESDHSEALSERDDVIAVLKAENAELTAELNAWRYRWHQVRVLMDEPLECRQTKGESSDDGIITSHNELFELIEKGGE